MAPVAGGSDAEANFNAGSAGHSSEASGSDSSHSSEHDHDEGAEGFPFHDLKWIAGDDVGTEVLAWALHDRAAAGNSYSQIKDVLIYAGDDSLLQPPAAAELSQEPPHICKLAEELLRSAAEHRDQCVLLLGDAASGKTTNANALLHYLGFHDTGHLGRQLLMTRDALRPFISALPLDCSSGSPSTRAVLSTEVVIDLTVDLTDVRGHIARVTPKVQMLEVEPLRVGGSCGPFQAFQLAASSPTAAQWLGGRRSFRLLRGEIAESPSPDEGSAWLRALKTFSVREEELLRVLSAILLLGEVDFRQTRQGIETVPADGLAVAFKVLGVLDSANVRLLESVMTARGSAEAAQRALQGTINDLYRGLVAAVLESISERMRIEGTREEEAMITVVEVPASCQAATAWDTDGRGSFDNLKLQWLIETVRADLLRAALQVDVPPGKAIQKYGAARESAADGALNAIEGKHGILGVLRRAVQAEPGATLPGQAAIPSGDRPVKPAELQKRRRQRILEGWAAEVQASSKMRALWVQRELDDRHEWGCKVSGALGVRSHVFDEDLFAAFLPAAPRPILTTLSTVGTAGLFLTTALASCALALPSEVRDAENAIAFLRRLMQADKTRPSLVVCVRAGYPDYADVDLKALRQQLSSWMLDDLLQLARGDWSIVWPIPVFRDRYSEVIKTFGYDPHHPHEKPSAALAAFKEGCRAFLDHEGQRCPPGEEKVGVVGASSIYISNRVQQSLERRLRQGSSAEFGGGSRPPAAPRSRRHEQAKEMKDMKALQETELRAFQRKWQEELREMQRKHEQMLREKCSEQLPFPEDMRGCLGDSTVSRTSRSGMSRSCLKGHSDEFGQSRYGFVPAARKGVYWSIAPELPDGMADDYKASLHADLARMAALMRLAKESEARGREVQAQRDEVLGHLLQERDTWHFESKRLEKQTRMLGKQVAAAKGLPWQDSSGSESGSHSLSKDESFSASSKVENSEQQSSMDAAQAKMRERRYGLMPAALDVVQVAVTRNHRCLTKLGVIV
eukprot:TRINITY_DN19806_c0_g1_i1.p1 TRINITY_DN19806_c0_g1~~TRINITY_DN19806_c0_g1_i1.p1  ORF type:complete len:1023 (+),score=226.99 TRINITY_DN19806_c0_g1_i1:131-3199(+)